MPSSRISRRGSKTTRQHNRSTRRPPATLEQRRQVRYLARHYPDLKTNQIAKTAGCASSAVPKILANTFGGGDTDPDALPRDEVFLRKHGIQDEIELEVTVPVRHKSSSGGQRQVHEDIREIVGAEDELNDQTIASQKPNPDERDELRWVAGFFNNNTKNLGNMKLPASVIREMVAAGFKHYTVTHLMKTYTNKLELSNYLATTLRVTHIERDIIAGLIMEQRNRSWVLKREQYD